MFEAYQDLALLLARIIVGALFIVHGYPKLFGKPGIIGFGNWLRKQGYIVPFLSALVVSVAEFFGGILIIFGVYVEYAAILLTVVMFVATYHTKFKDKKPFKGGWELDVLLIGTLLLLATIGPGNYVIL